MRLQASTVFALLVALAFAPGESRANCSSHPADVAPGTLDGGLPIPTWTVTGNGRVDVQDVLALLNAAVGNRLLAWTPPLEPNCLALPGNLSPGAEDEDFSPPRWTPAPNGVIDVGDVLVALRMSVSLIVLDPTWFAPVVANGQVADRVVTGSVIDSVSSSALPAVVVTALQDGEAVGTTSTDAEGKFLLQGLPSGIIKLKLDGSSSSAAGKFSVLEVQVAVDTAATTSVAPITLPDESDPAGASGKFAGDASGTIAEEVALTSDAGDVGLATGPGGKILVEGEPAEGDVDLSVVPIGGESLPGTLADTETGDSLNSTGQVAIGPAAGKFSGGGAGAGSIVLSGTGAEPGFDLTLPNDKELAVGTIVDIWRWNGQSWDNCSAATGRTGVVIDLGDGESAVFAAGAATDGGLHSAALAVDPACVSSLSGTVRDQFGAPLRGVFVGSSLGASVFTDALGRFLLEGLPAYTGAGAGDCEPAGYELVIRAGVELGSVTAGRAVEDLEVQIGSETELGEIVLTVPNEGCLSGLVLLNGLPQAGPVTITGPESTMLSADEEGRFFEAGLSPGEYRASFLFPGEPVAREFSFEVRARECTTLRLAISGGVGTQRLTVDLRYDHDRDLLTPSEAAGGALVRLVGSDRVSALGLEAIADPSGRVVFDSVSPPYDLLAVLELPLSSEAVGVTALAEGAIMRIGAGLTTPAPSGQASVLLRLPASVDARRPPVEGLVSGTVVNLPPLSAGQEHAAGSLRRTAFESPAEGALDTPTGTYSAPASTDPFDLAVLVRSDAAPFRVREMALFGPFQLPLPLEGQPEPALGDAPLLALDLDYNAGQRLVFSPLSVGYSELVTGGNPKTWTTGGGRADGRGFRVLEGEVEGSGAFPSTLRVPPLPSSDLRFFFELASEPDSLGIGQSCLVPVRAPSTPCVLPPCLGVEFLSPPRIVSPTGPSVSADRLVDGSVDFEAGSGSSARGFDAVRYETLFPEAGAGSLAVASFERFLEASAFGSSTIGPTPEEFVFAGEPLELSVESFRGDGLPAAFSDLFGAELDALLAGLPLQANPTCSGSETRSYEVSPAP